MQNAIIEIVFSSFEKNAAASFAKHFDLTALLAGVYFLKVNGDDIWFEEDLGNEVSSKRYQSSGINILLSPQ